MRLKYATRITVIELVGYREWTESLGSDREWFIQETQATLYKSLQEVASRLGGFVLPVRYDYMLILASNINVDDHREILEIASQNSKVEVRIASSCDKTPLGAERRALEILRKIRGDGLAYEVCGDDEIVVIAHLDVNNITLNTLSEGVVKTYHTMLNLISRLADLIEPRGGVIQYLGGDNILVVLPVEEYLSSATLLIRESNLKAGLGIARTAREALKLAAQALHEIRSRVDKRNMVISYIDL
ncbi:MAG: GTP cyclohydrolase IIa [Acidilobaceae archaeon]